MDKEQQTNPQAPDFSNEEMKMPENIRHTPEAEDTHSPLNGVVITILVLVLLGILGGLYVWFTELTASTQPAPTPAIERPTPEENNEPESTTAEAAVTTQQTLSTSDELVTIEADLLATDLDSLEAELEAIEAELEAALSE